MDGQNNCKKMRKIMLPVFFVLFIFLRVLMIFAEEEEENQPGGSRTEFPEIHCTEPDGEKGWYLSGPDITIIHKAPEAVTKFRVSLPSGKTEEGDLPAERQEDLQEKAEKEGEQKGELLKEEDGQTELSAVHVISGDIFEEGKNILEVWMISSEDEEEVFCLRKEIMVDLEPPGEVEIKIPSYPDGNRSFFHSEVEIDVKCTDRASGVDAIYVCLDGNREQLIPGERGTITVPPGYRGKISAYAKDCSGRKSETYTAGPILCEDDAPTVEIQIAGGTAVWRQNSTEVEVCVKDGEDAYGFSSGLRSVTCYTGRQIVAKRTWEYEGEQVLSETLRFKVAQSSSGGSPVPVTVHVSDRAGNTAVLTERLYLDFHPPEAEISGVRSGMIAGECRKAVFTLKDENILKECSLKVFRARIDGTTEIVVETVPEDWRGTVREKRIEVEFSEDGKYVCTVTGTDASGRRTEKTISFIIDRTDPVIRYVEQLNGSHIPLFQWNYGKEMIQDLTENSYRMYLNGREYFTGTRITTEGRYLLEVRAWDQAGNHASAEAVFTIDHTGPAICWGELREGSVYEEGVLLTVWVEGKGERLSGLYINGEKQRLDYESRIFQYEILRSGNYTVIARAEDLTGNFTEKSITFKVKGKKGFMPAVFQMPETIASESLTDGGGKEIFLLFLTVPAAAVLIYICLRKIRRYISGRKKH